MLINRALLKHGYSKFKLEIVEYCNPKELAKKEQYYMDMMSPQYNILKTAYSSLGYKHNEKTLEKMHTNLQNLNSSKSIEVTVTNLQTNVSQQYPSLTEAAKSINISRPVLRKHILNSCIYKDTYKLEANLSVLNLNSNYLNHPASIKIKVTDLKSNIVNQYASIRAAARDLKIGYVSIATYLKRNQKTPYKSRYVFKYVL